MRCMLCGEEMRLVRAVRDEALLVPGFEHHILSCPSCHDEETRLVFIDQAAPLSPSAATGELKRTCSMCGYRPPPLPGRSMKRRRRSRSSGQKGCCQSRVSHRHHPLLCCQSPEPPLLRVREFGAAEPSCIVRAGRCCVAASGCGSQAGSRIRPQEADLSRSQSPLISARNGR
jgi:hypothetical protein